jgi:hypothetical protein
VILYHVADEQVAQAILRDGFLDGNGGYLTERLWSGVWLSDRALDVTDGASQGTVLAIEFSCHDKALAEYEWYEYGNAYRQWLVPAVFIRENARVSDVTDHLRRSARAYVCSRIIPGHDGTRKKRITQLF